jgi:hypothetical protein
MRAVLRDIAPNLVLAAAYFGTAKLGLLFALFGSNVSLIWPASGIAVAALVLAGLRLFPGVAVGAFLANLSLGAPPFTAAVIALGSTLAAVAAAWLLARPAADDADRFDAGLRRVRDVLRLIFPAAPGTPVIAAAIGVAALAQRPAGRIRAVIRAGSHGGRATRSGVLRAARAAWARPAPAHRRRGGARARRAHRRGALRRRGRDGEPPAAGATEILAACVVPARRLAPAVRSMREVATFNVALCDARGRRSVVRAGTADHRGRRGGFGRDRGPALPRSR